MTRLEESLQRIGVLDTTVAELHRKFDNLDDRVNRIAASNEKRTESISAMVKASEAKIDKLEASIQTLLASLNQRPVQAESSGAQQANHLPSSSQYHSQVHNPILEPNRGNNELGYRPVEYRSENREGLYKKVEMPMFSGSDPFDWIANSKRYFRVMRCSPDYKMDLVSLSLTEDALSWFNYELDYHPFHDWCEFKRRVLARFAESFEKTPGKRLFGIQQTGSLAEYVREFQALAHQVKLAEENLIDIFFNGLKQEFKEVIKMKEPKKLPDHIEAIIKMEDSEFCRMFAAAKGLENKGGKQSSSSWQRSASLGGSSNWKRRPALPEATPKQSDRQRQQKGSEKGGPPIKLSDAEYEHKKRNGFCYKCPERWSKTHVCKNKQLQVMVVTKGREIE